MIDWPMIGSLTPPVLLGLTVLFILTDRLVPKSRLNEKQKECDKWERAWEKTEQARALSEKQTTELLEQNKTSHQILVAIFEIIRRSSEGAHRVVPRKK